MTGIFDSGAGGLAALSELRRLLPGEDILFLADVKNAPYGTKSPEEIVALATENIRKLTGAGAERVLIACCTASAFHERLPRAERLISTPIIEPAARRAAEVTKNGRIAVIATKLTARSGAFGKALSRLGTDVKVLEREAQELVEIAERVAHGVPLSDRDREEIRRAVAPARDFGADTIVLGCTHFSHLATEIERTLENVSTVDCAKIGARRIAERGGCGLGRTVLL